MKQLKKNDKVAIVSLSFGILGEPFVSHELQLGKKRLEEMGLVPVFMPNSLKGIEFLKQHPEARAEDLKTAFKDPEIKMILCAIGGFDTHRTIPYLLGDKEFVETVKNNPKIFIGYSDSTTNHLTLYKLGLKTFYGMALLTDFAEFENEMLPYTKSAFLRFFEPKIPYLIESSPVWYADRTDFSPAAVGTNRVRKNEIRGYEVLQGTKKVTGKLLGGCFDVLTHLAFPTDEEEIEIKNKFDVFPTLDEWNGKILFTEPSDSKMEPEKFRENIKKFKKFGLFNRISGMIFGKPIDEVFYDEYKTILKEELSEFDFPIIINLNFGHAYPHTIIPYGEECELDPKNKTITILTSSLEK
ncbi:MAG: LD-carboxypeptidase [Clostridia bacterium]|nr:LD-carboxypeptidase [Clostridia bacterium]